MKLHKNKLIGIAGGSGSGKSTLINETLYPILSTHAYGSRVSPHEYKNVKGLEHIDKVIEIDQQNRKLVPFTARKRFAKREPFFQQSPVWQPREGIV